MRKFKSHQLVLLIVLTAGLVLMAGLGLADAAAPGSQSVDGRVENGVRVIEVSPDQLPGTISVFRGDTVQLNISGATQPVSVNIPDFKINQASQAGQGMTLKFKAAQLGQFPIYVQNNGQAGPGRSGWIMVLQYESAPSAVYREFTAEQASGFIAQNAPFILDVRTDGEYREGHLANSVLIPVQELARRLSEIESYKNKDIFIYCHSGNRSTVAAAIMEKSGFKRLYNLRYGIVDWARRGYPVVK